MSDSDIDPGIRIFADPRSQAETAIIALIAEDEFVRARILIPDLNAYSDYEDWRESREGFEMGLAMAGVDVKMAPVALTPFLIWCRLTRTPPSERALNAFASTILRFRTSSDPLVFAVIDEREFEAHSRDVAAFSTHCDYRQWLRHRYATHAQAVTSGREIEELPISISDFAAWSACVADICEPSINRYAHLLLEHLACDFGE